MSARWHKWWRGVFVGRLPRSQPAGRRLGALSSWNLQHPPTCRATQILHVTKLHEGNILQDPPRQGMGVKNFWPQFLTIIIISSSSSIIRIIIVSLSKKNFKNTVRSTIQNTALPALPFVSFQFIPSESERNSAVADKLRDAFVRGWPN